MERFDLQHWTRIETMNHQGVKRGTNRQLFLHPFVIVQLIYLERVTRFIRLSWLQTVGELYTIRGPIPGSFLIINCAQVLHA